MQTEMLAMSMVFLVLGIVLGLRANVRQLAVAAAAAALLVFVAAVGTTQGAARGGLLATAALVCLQVGYFVSIFVQARLAARGRDSGGRG